MSTAQVHEAIELPVPKFLTEEELARYLSVKVSFLRQLRDQGDGPVFSDRNGIIRYSQEDLDDWLDFRKTVTDLTYAIAGAFSIPKLAARLLKTDTQEDAIDELVTFVVKQIRSQS